jgi:predicted transcriptional regulator YdeE
MSVTARALCTSKATLDIGATCSAIWNQGLPDSGYQAADSPWFERYGEEFDGRTGLGGLEIWIPIALRVSPA